MSKKKEPKDPVVKEEIDASAEAAPASAKEDATLVEEPTTEAGGYTLTSEEFEAAKAHIASLQKERDDTVLLMQRVQADFDNYRRRNASIRLDSCEEGKRDCIKALLPVLDNFDRAMENAGSVDASWRDGVALVQKQLLDTLQKQGLEEVEACGQFDPNMHEAVMREKVEGKASGEILFVLQKGYRVGDRIIRHTMVKVAE